MLATDGVIRWLGQPVGKLVAGEEVLKPRLRIIADEHLTGASRDAVQARLDLWLKSHIEKFLAPLFQLAAAEDITGIARGVAFQLAEALGVLERAKVAEEVKGLDQPTRATLRKYGVRFGAYHIYVPALLKPAPRVLATQLYALKHGGSGDQRARRDRAARRQRPHLDRRRPGHCEGALPHRRLSRLRRARGARRYSGTARRPHPSGAGLAGRSAGVKPAGAIDGFGFTVTTGMTSLAGLFGRGFRLGLALARLSHGEAAEAAPSSRAPRLQTSQ